MVDVIAPGFTIQSDQVEADDDEAVRMFVFQSGYGDWQAWIATDWSQTCLGSGSTRDQAVGQAVRKLESALEELQKPCE